MKIWVELASSEFRILVTSVSLELDARKEDGVGGGLPDTLTQMLFESLELWARFMFVYCLSNEDSHCSQSSTGAKGKVVANCLIWKYWPKLLLP
jgi:hypothetical protein